ncbi:MAG: UbiD family decarboxylase [Sediminibacterium sp.]|nr:UbiD family decarboxylase [Sediminibacterium sp.]
MRIKEEVDPYLEMAAIHLETYKQNGPAILFEKVKGSKYRAVSNLFGTKERRKFIFRTTVNQVKKLIELKVNPVSILQNWHQLPALIRTLYNSFPYRNDGKIKSNFDEILIQDLPLIHHWEKDGGAFVTLPQVYTENLLKKGIKYSNIGMYRIQLTGNDYTLNKEIGLHYQLHRGIGIHHTLAKELKKPLKVSCFVGGPPAHTLAAVMPLPENISETNFAGALSGRRFRYGYLNDFCISTDADFIIIGEVQSENKIEGPFGDHLGYYSLQHPFPYLKVEKVFAKKNAIWHFTVVGRPPQEDTQFGEMIHDLVGDVIKYDIPGIEAIQAVDEAGVHPLLLAIGKERYTPYLVNKQPAEILTIAHHILGTGQLSLAKFLFITSDETNQLNIQNYPLYFTYILERIDFKRDIHFITNTTMDTLDYSGTDINAGSKVIFASNGEKKRNLCIEIPALIKENAFIKNTCLIQPGIIAIEINAFISYNQAAIEISALNHVLKDNATELLNIHGLALIIICDDANLMNEYNNFLWIGFTRANPAKDIYGIHEFTENKHWGCNGSLIIDARKKPFHAPVLEINKKITEKALKILSKYTF